MPMLGKISFFTGYSKYFGETLRRFHITFALAISLLISKGVPCYAQDEISESFPESSSASFESETTETPPSSQKLLFDLTDCIRMGVRNNAEVRGADYDVEEAKWKLSEAQPRGVPVITYEYEAAPVPKDASRALETFFEGDITMLNRVKLGLGIPLTTFGKVTFAQALAREGIEASLEKRNQKTSEVVLKIKQLYYGLLLARELKPMLEDATQKLENEISKREASENTPNPLELAKLKLTHYDLLKRLGDVSKKEALAAEGLRIQMGLSRGHPFDLADRHLRPVEFELKDLSFYLEESKRYRPESKLLDIALRAKENEYRLEKRKLLPNLGVGGFFELGRTLDEVQNVGTSSDFNDPFHFTRAGVGIRLSGEFNLKQGKARIRQKQASYYKMSATKDLAEEGLDLDLRESYLTVQQSKIDLENAEKAQRLARQVVFLTKTNNDVGVGDTKDYGEALQGYLLMKGRYHEAVFNFNTAVATLMSKAGYQYQP